jgi:hypothetical protein
LITPLHFVSSAFSLSFGEDWGEVKAEASGEVKALGQKKPELSNQL